MVRLQARAPEASGSRHQTEAQRQIGAKSLGTVATARDEGSVTAFVAILGASLLLVTGLIVDGGRLLHRYVEAHDVAGNAARAGAQEVVLGEPGVAGEGLYGGDTTPQVNEVEATTRVDQFLNEAGYSGADYAVAVDGDRVTVEVTLTQSLIMLPPGSQSVAANASAVAQRGVEEPA